MPQGSHMVSLVVNGLNGMIFWREAFLSWKSITSILAHTYSIPIWYYQSETAPLGEKLSFGLVKWLG